MPTTADLQRLLHAFGRQATLAEAAIVNRQADATDQLVAAAILLGHVMQIRDDLAVVERKMFSFEINQALARLEKIPRR